MKFPERGLILIGLLAWAAPCVLGLGWDNILQDGNHMQDLADQPQLAFDPFTGPGSSNDSEKDRPFNTLVTGSVGTGTATRPGEIVSESPSISKKPVQPSRPPPEVQPPKPTLPEPTTPKPTPTPSKTKIFGSWKTPSQSTGAGSVEKPPTPEKVSGGSKPVGGPGSSLAVIGGGKGSGSSPIAQFLMNMGGNKNKEGGELGSLFDDSPSRFGGFKPFGSSMGIPGRFKSMFQKPQGGYGGLAGLGGLGSLGSFGSLGGLGRFGSGLGGSFGGGFGSFGGFR